MQPAAVLPSRRRRSIWAAMREWTNKRRRRLSRRCKSGARKAGCPSPTSRRPIFLRSAIRCPIRNRVLRSEESKTRASANQYTAALMRWRHSMRPAIYLTLFTAAVAVLVPQVHSWEVPMQSSMASPASATGVTPSWVKDSVAKLERELVAKYGESQGARVHRGLQQVAEFWRTEDGDVATFEDFVRANFAGDQATLDTMFNRLESLLEQLGGHMHEINREFRQQSDLDLGPVLPFDEIIGGYDPSAHVLDDFFQNKLAFVVLLNFPLTTLDQRLQNGPSWTRRQWAEARLAQGFSKRIPADVSLGIAQAEAQAGHYIAEYNVGMYHLVDAQGQRLFPPKMRLLSHWNLRDEIKADR